MLRRKRCTSQLINLLPYQLCYASISGLCNSRCCKVHYFSLFQSDNVTAMRQERRRDTPSHTSAEKHWQIRYDSHNMAIAPEGDNTADAPDGLNAAATSDGSTRQMHQTDTTWQMHHDGHYTADTPRRTLHCSYTTTDKTRQIHHE